MGQVYRATDTRLGRSIALIISDGKLMSAAIREGKPIEAGAPGAPVPGAYAGRTWRVD